MYKVDFIKVFCFLDKGKGGGVVFFWIVGERFYNEVSRLSEKGFVFCFFGRLGVGSY